MKTSTFKTYAEAKTYFDGLTVDATLASVNKGAEWSVTVADFDLHQELVANAEGCVSRRADGTVWQSVCLSNLSHPYSPREFAGKLSALEAKGLYKRMDGYFGMVKIS